MTMITTDRMNRRQFFEKVGKGSLVVGFSLSPVAASILARRGTRGKCRLELTILSGINSGSPPQNDAWLTIDHQGNITFLSGKVELGTGTQTAFTQIVAEELYVDVSAITYVQGDTSQTPDQGFTAGSKSIQTQGPLVRRAAATAFQQLLSLASAYLGVPTSQLMANDGSIGIGPIDEAPDEVRQAVCRSADFVDQQLRRADSRMPSNYTVVGRPVHRVDLPDKFTGKFTFVSDIVLPGMLHGRVVRVNGNRASPRTPPSNR